MISLLDSDQLSHYALSSLELSRPLMSPGPQAWRTKHSVSCMLGRSRPRGPGWPDCAERADAGKRVCVSGLRASEAAQLLRLCPESQVVRLGRTFRMDDRTFLIPTRRFSLFC